MTVYVDNMRMPATVGSITAAWSHLTADTKEELHAFARSIWLQRSWFQDKPNGLWHYDVTESKRQMALRLGAEMIVYGDMDDFDRVWRRPGREGRAHRLLRTTCPECANDVQVSGVNDDEEMKCPQCGSCYVKRGGVGPWVFVRSLYPWQHPMVSVSIRTM